ncbi:uncharacterized protein EI90DRAFT_2534240 [Cantharellus anzutake]|uniref:uncharacterized protein n=1 Tax=Cantharellus anzutake TaxID=1750568 RepID=UPI001908A7C4|nr:uncharacterized protein EI90DRAFT_2534240 [Cantharellus anzutake]KAF8338039.1 hypothetical protein EI90DRAFT_2534240 [Cantharellus anzutake]
MTCMRPICSFRMDRQILRSSLNILHALWRLVLLLCLCVPNPRTGFDGSSLLAGSARSRTLLAGIWNGGRGSMLKTRDTAVSSGILWWLISLLPLIVINVSTIHELF